MQGGSDWKGVSRFYHHMYACASMDESAERVVKAVDGVPASHGTVLVSHNGPAGLGAHASALCGADFLEGGGDWGDPDLRSALDSLRSDGRCGPGSCFFFHFFFSVCCGDPCRGSHEQQVDNKHAIAQRAPLKRSRAFTRWS